MNFGGMYNQALTAWDSYLGSQRKQTNIIGQTWLDEAANTKRLGEITQQAGLGEDLLGLAGELVPEEQMWGGQDEHANWLTRLGPTPWEATKGAGKGIYAPFKWLGKQIQEKKPWEGWVPGI